MMKMNEKQKDILLRAVKTFAETVIGYVIAELSGVDLFGGDVNAHFIRALVLSALAAGVSAVWNGVAAPLLKTDRRKEEETE